MKVKLTKPATISGVDFPADFEVTVNDRTAEYLISVGGAVRVVEAETEASEYSANSDDNDPPLADIED